MKRIIIFILLAVTLCATSCTTPRYVSAEPYYNDEWVGRSYADIVQTFGAPDRESSDGLGGSIIVYQDGITEMIGGYYGPTIIRNGENYVQYFIGDDDVCYKVMTDHVVQDGNKIDILSSLVVVGTAMALLIGAVAN
jgi:hypothetical protein